jgi:hypothetical protein
LILIIAAHRGFNIVPFQEVYCTAMQHGSKADDGSDRGPARGLFRRAEVLVGSGDRRRRASSARGPSPTSFGRLGLTRARQPRSSGFSSMAGALGCLREGFTSRQRGRTSRATFGAVLRACLVCLGVHAIPVSMPSLCPCHSVWHAACAHPACVHAMSTRAWRECTRAWRECTRAQRAADVGECGATTGG